MCSMDRNRAYQLYILYNAVYQIIESNQMKNDATPQKEYNKKINK